MLAPGILDILRIQQPGAGGEIQLAKAINPEVPNNVVEKVKLKGLRFDCDNEKGYADEIMRV